ncbi:MAG: hypothetical protein ACI87V_001599, partial [Flavobacteriales bacterium]
MKKEKATIWPPFMHRVIPMALFHHDSSGDC